MCSERLIYRLPEGAWTEENSDFFFSGDLGPLPYWTFKDRGRSFGLRDLRQISKAPLTPKGMLSVLESYGSWHLCNRSSMETESSARELTQISFTNWRVSAIQIMRAYSLLGLLRRGEVPTWKVERRGTIPYLAITSWPEKLAMPTEKEPSAFFLSAVPISRDEARYDDEATSRKLAKKLVANWINEELSAVKLGVAYDFATDSFRTDASENEVLDLQVACWLILRDLAFGLSGLRFCSAPGCKSQIDPAKRQDAKTCGKAACQKRLQRKRVKNGKTR